MRLQALSELVRVRRQALGLTQAKLEKLADLSRQTVQRLEAGTIVDLSFGRVTNLLTILGLNFDMPSLDSRQRKRGLWMAAQTSSVSYQGELSSTDLQRALATGETPERYAAQILHFLDEAPVPIVVMAIEEAAAKERMPAELIWANLKTLANQLDASRRALWD